MHDFLHFENILHIFLLFWHVFSSILLKRMCLGTFSRRARLPRQPSTLAPSAHPRGAFLSYGNEVSYTTGKRRNSFGIPPLLLFLILKSLPTRAHHPASLLRCKSLKNKVIEGSAAGIQLCLTFYCPCNGRTAKQVPADVFGYCMHCTAII